MIRPFGITVVIFLTAATLYAFPAREKQAEYFCGIILLESDPALAADVKTMRYQSLETITGITAAEAYKLLTYYRERPEEWQQLYDTMIKLLNDQNTAMRKLLPSPERNNHH